MPIQIKSLLVYNFSNQYFISAKIIIILIVFNIFNTWGNLSDFTLWYFSS